MNRRLLVLCALGNALSLFATPTVAAGAPTSAAELLATAAADPRLADARAELVSRARTLVERGVITRAQTGADLEGRRIKPSGSIARIADPTIRERFALASYDANAASSLSLELPVIAAAARFSHDETLLAHLRAQLTEVATWQPLQRPGWSLASQSRELPPEGDGPWLATGWAIRAIADTIELLPSDALAIDLRARIDALLDAEIARIASAWRSGQPWYVQRRMANSNQWVIPAEGLVRGCLFRGRGRGDPDYELGVSALLESLNAQGEAGEFTEGLTYAGITLRGLVSAARASARVGDHRLAEHLFLRRTGTWFAHHVQPGGFLVNAFDTLNGARGQLSVFGNVFATLAGLGDPHALWILRERDLPGDSLDHLLARAAAPSASSEPPLFASYPVGTRVVWRSSWDDTTATGLWLRGGGARDFHDHADRGHVNFVIGQHALLIEAGTPPYGTPDAERLYTGLAGHNVLQIGPDADDSTPQKFRRALAPVTVHRLDASGGSVTIDASAAYPEATRWLRHVTWDASRLRVRDEVRLPAPAELAFRWHLGEAADAPQDRSPDSLRVGATRLDVHADEPLSLSVVSMPDATLRAKTLGVHACVVVRSAGPVSSLVAETVLSRE